MDKNELEFSKKIADCFEKSSYLVRREVNSGYGIADVVAIKANNKNVNKRLHYKQTTKIPSENYFKVLNLLTETAQKAKPLKEITSRLSISDSYVKNTIIKDLIKSKFVKEIEGKIYYKINGWAPLSREIIAIESKLYDWNRGITQAIRYKTFADKVYLALPEENVHLVDRKLLKKYNLGLLTLKDDNLKTLFHPIRQKKEIIESKKDYVCEYFWNEMKLNVNAF